MACSAVHSRYPARWARGERRDWRPSRLANQIPTRRLLFTTCAGYDSGRIARSISEQVAKALIANADEPQWRGLLPVEPIDLNLADASPN